MSDPLPPCEDETTEGDMTDEEFNAVFRELGLMLREKAVKALLAGGNTCFTTRQYKTAYEQYAWSSPSKVLWDIVNGKDLAVVHLESVPHLVYRLMPDVGLWFRVIPGRRKVCLPS